MDWIKAKWEKSIWWVVISLLSLLILVFAIQQYMSHQQVKKIEAVNVAYNRLIPQDINAYPELKREAESNTTEYDQLMQSLTAFNVKFDPLLFKKQARNAVLDCQTIKSKIEDFDKDGLTVFDQEIDADHYKSVKDLKSVLNTIPSISKQYTEYSLDKRLSYKEFCSLTKMLDLWVNYKDTLDTKNLVIKLQNDQ